MKKVLIPIMLILIPFGLLVWQRFDTGPRTEVIVLASKNSPSVVGTHLRRGEIIETGAKEYVAIQLGETSIGLSERTSLEPVRLGHEWIFKCSRGRIIVHNPSNHPLSVHTLKTQTSVTNAMATFINFDFLQKVHVIPLYQSIQTHFIDTNETLILPGAVAIDESQTTSYELISFDVLNNTASDFYTWFDKVVLSE